MIFASADLFDLFREAANGPCTVRKPIRLTHFRGHTDRTLLLVSVHPLQCLGTAATTLIVPAVQVRIKGDMLAKRRLLFCLGDNAYETALPFESICICDEIPRRHDFHLPNRQGCVSSAKRSEMRGYIENVLLNVVVCLIGSKFGQFPKGNIKRKHQMETPNSIIH